MTGTDMIERLADLEHQQWAHWTRYMLDNLTPENITRWKAQIETPYSELTEKEKESDREWARKSLKAIREPTDEMVHAGDSEFMEQTPYHYTPYPGAIKLAFQAMIDTALTEEKADG